MHALQQQLGTLDNGVRAISHVVRGHRHASFDVWMAHRWWRTINARAPSLVLQGVVTYKYVLPGLAMHGVLAHHHVGRVEQGRVRSTASKMEQLSAMRSAPQMVQDPNLQRVNPVIQESLAQHGQSAPTDHVLRRVGEERRQEQSFASVEQRR